MRPDYSSDFGFWNNSKLAATLILVWVTGLLVFRWFPNIDIATANYFYDSSLCANLAEKARCIGFPAASHPILAPLREFLHDSPRYIGIALLVYLIVQLILGQRWNDLALRKNALVIGALLLGPLLVVNGILKEFFGRVRPRDIIEYGGSKDFTLPGDFIGQCVSNCSFVSGEGSAGGWFLCLGVLLAAKYRPAAYTALFVLGLSMALLRVAFGAHFLSDALLGYLLSIIIFSLLVILSERSKTTPNN